MDLLTTPTPKSNTLVQSSTKKATATAKSVLEKLKSLGSTMENDVVASASETKGYSLDKFGDSDVGDYDASSSSSSSSVWTVLRYVLLVLAVGFVILNILALMGALPKPVEKFFEPLLKFLGHTAETVVKPNTTITSGPDKTVKPATAIDKTEDKDSAPPKASPKLLDKPPEQNPVPQPDEAGSMTQASQSGSKSGYCYIGEDRGFRSCIQVGVGDTCMSGDIFPTKEICINPNLRA